MIDTEEKKRDEAALCDHELELPWRAVRGQLACAARRANRSEVSALIAHEAAGPLAAIAAIGHAGRGEPFFAIKEAGMEMGLAICRSIIESDHGRLLAIGNQARGTLLGFTPADPSEGCGMNLGNVIVYIVDDDACVRESLSDLLESLGWRTVALGSAGEYLSYPRPHLPACLILDVELPDINGLDFQKQISHGDHPPIVFLTGHGDISSSVRAIKGGAVDFLTKPFTERDLVDAIQSAVERDRAVRQERAELETLRERLVTLTRREREVLPLVVSGLLNKQAAAELGISEVTLQIHRS